MERYDNNNAGNGDEISGYIGYSDSIDIRRIFNEVEMCSL
jgi:hypothetical protein